MASNTNIQITDLDFSSIKSNFINYLQSQDTFKDYNFAGSGLSVLLDVLAYNTQYNAYYLNMVANEMFLDSAIQRSSVVSQAKVLNYVPKSAIAPSAFINMQVSGINGTSYTLPKFTNFLSEAINGVNYNFVTTDSVTVNTVQNGASIANSNLVYSTAYFTDIELKQGIPATYTFTVDSTANPSYTFQIPDNAVDTTSIQVIVQQSVSNTSYDIYTLSSNYLTLDSTSKVYFLQEASNGNYEIYFGDGILGTQLSDGNLVIVSYITTQGTSAGEANNFVLMDSLQNASNFVITPVSAASTGSEKESITSIKFQAPKSYSAQGRAVSKNDYITAIQQNTLGFSFDAVNVWGGEENDPPAYGQVFVSLKPSGSYTLTSTQKQRIVEEVIKPISVLTVSPVIVDPDYTYIKLNVNVYYDPAKTTQTSGMIASGVQNAIYGFASSTLNTFNSTFSSYDLLNTIQNYSNSILSSDFSMSLQKKFYPNLTTPTTYNLYYNSPIKKGILESGVNSSPAMKFIDPSNFTNIIDGVYIEEVPVYTGGISSISVLNPGFNYQSVPTVTILGDGSGATAHAVIVNGRIQSIVVDTAGSGYTNALVVITPASGDTTGSSGAATATLEGQYGTLRTYYYNTSQVKTVLNNNIGTVDYVNGIVTLNSFNPYDVDNSLGQLAVNVNPTTNIISSTYNRIITIDPYDSTAITVNVIAKTR